MTLSKIKDQIQKQNNAEAKLIQAKSDKERLAIEKNQALVTSVIERIKSNLKKMANGEMKVRENKGFVFVSDTNKSPLNQVSTPYQPVDRDDLEFINVYRSLMTEETIADFTQFLSDFEISRILVSSQHCGGGMSSWNEFYFKL